MLRRFVIGLLWFLVTSCCHVVSAQVTNGTIAGRVEDQDGALLSGAQITFTNTETGTIRTLTTDRQGWYRALALQVGNYEVRADSTGFQPQVRTGINLSVGREAIVNFKLNVGTIREALIVHSEAPFVDLMSSTISGLVSEKQMRNLPLNSRSFQQLVALQTGVAVLGLAYHGGDAGTGRSERISVSGARPTANNFLLDGVDMKDATGQAPVSAAKNILGMDTIYEFAILTNNYNAEYGGGGAVINIVTRSGTNQFHGNLFEFYRNSALDAKNFFDRADAPIPLFKRNQFGGTAGGPIHKNRAFIFGGYEGLRESSGLSNIGFVPDVNARLGWLPDLSHPGQLVSVGVSPAVKKYLDLFPLPNGRDFGDGRAEFLSSPRQTTVEDHGILRVDHKPNQSTSAFIRYSFYQGNVSTPDQLGLTRRTEESRQQYLTLEQTRIISSRWLNVMRFGYNRSDQSSFFVPLFDNPNSYNFLSGPDRTFGTAGGIEFGFTSPQLVTGAPISRLGAPLNVPKSHLQNLYHYQDQISYNRGGHSIKIGFEGKRYQIRSDTPSAQSGTYLFSGALRDFLENRPTLFMGLLPGSTALRYLHQSLFGWYVQDELRLKRNFTLNLGLRHEFVTLIREKFGTESNLRYPSDTRPTVGPVYRNPSLKNFEPRIGFAWDPFRTGITSIRAGFGVFHEQLQYDQAYTIFNRQPPFFVRANLSSPSFPDPYGPAGVLRPAVTPGIQSVDFNAKSPTLLAYNLTVQRQVIRSTVLSVSYVGSHGYHLTRAYEANIATPQILPGGTKFFPLGLSRRNPNFGSDWRMSFNANSFYNSLQLSINRRTARGLQFQISYTFSKNIDDNTGRWDVYAGQSFTMQDPDDFKSDRALSPIDVTQVLTFNYSYDLRLGHPRSQVASKLVTGWQISGITNISTGPPFTVRLGFNGSRNLNNFQLADRPNLLPGFNSNNVILGGPDMYFNPKAFQLPAPGFYGTLGRNTFRAPGIVNFDFAIIKNSKIRDKIGVQFRAEFFNLFNHPNFGLPVPFVFNDASGLPSANAGRIIQTSTPSRQIQLALRLSY